MRCCDCAHARAPCSNRGLSHARDRSAGFEVAGQLTDMTLYEAIPEHLRPDPQELAQELMAQKLAQELELAQAQALAQAAAVVLFADVQLAPTPSLTVFLLLQLKLGLMIQTAMRWQQC